MGRKRTRPMDMKVFCEIWRDEDFCSLTLDAQALAFRSIGYLGRDAKLSGTYTAADLGLDPFEFDMVARDLVRVGIWTWVDDDRVEVCQYKDLILLIPPNRPRIPLPLRQTVHVRDGWACLHCGARDGLQLDHVYPYSLGGETTLDNLQTLCGPCNRAKGMRVDAR